MKPEVNLRSESGQAIVEYILMLAVVLSAFLIVQRGLGKIGLMKRMMEPLNKEFAKAYQYGHPAADSFASGSPKHPANRLFIEVPQ